MKPLELLEYLQGVLEDGCTATDVSGLTFSKGLPVVLEHDGETCPVHETMEVTI